MAYCDPNSLMLGTIEVPPGERENYTELGAKEMDAELGFSYAIPLTPISPATELTAHVKAILEKANRLISSGRLLLARNASVEDALHAYGVSLLAEGRDLLSQITTGTMPLPGVVRAGTNNVEDGGGGPLIIQGDDASGVDAYYDWMQRDDANPTAYVWMPGTSS